MFSKHQLRERCAPLHRIRTRDVQTQCHAPWPVGCERVHMTLVQFSSDIPVLRNTFAYSIFVTHHICEILSCKKIGRDGFEPVTYRPHVMRHDQSAVKEHIWHWFSLVVTYQCHVTYLLTHSTWTNTFVNFCVMVKWPPLVKTNSGILLYYLGVLDRWLKFLFANMEACSTCVTRVPGSADVKCLQKFTSATRRHTRTDAWKQLGTCTTRSTMLVT